MQFKTLILHKIRFEEKDIFVVYLDTVAFKELKKAETEYELVFNNGTVHATIAPTLVEN